MNSKTCLEKIFPEVELELGMVCRIGETTYIDSSRIKTLIRKKIDGKYYLLPCVFELSDENKKTDQILDENQED